MESYRLKKKYKELVKLGNAKSKAEDKFKKASDNYNKVEDEFKKMFMDEITFDRVKSLKEAIEKNGTLEEKNDYKVFFENYNNGNVDVALMEQYRTFYKRYGECTEEFRVVEEVLEGKC